MKLSEIVVDKEFRALIPQLQQEEREQLQANILRDKFRDPIVVWSEFGILLDGHNRLDIWKENFDSDESCGPKVHEMKFTSRDAAKVWMIKNQLGRRNLTDAMRVKLALQMKPELERQAKQNQKAGGGSGVSGRQNSDNPARVDDQIAEAAGVSRDTVRKVEKVLEKAPEEVKQKMLSGEMSINAAHNTTEKKKPESKPAKQVKLNAEQKELWVAVGEVSRIAEKEYRSISILELRKSAQRLRLAAKPFFGDEK